MSDPITLPRAEVEALLLAAQRGSALEGWIAATAQLMHASPGSTLDYMHPQPGSAGAFVQDFVAWTSGRGDMSPGCEDRLRGWGLKEARLRMDALFPAPKAAS